MVIEAPGAMPVEVERPTPDAGPGEVLVRVRGSSMNYHDLANLLGLMEGPFPRIPMTDAAGEVVGVGSGVTRFQLGDRVISTFYPEWRDGPPTQPSSMRYIPGDDGDGWLQQYVCAPESAVVPAPVHLSDEEAATLVCAGTTAWSAVEAGGVGPGDIVVTLGTGGVSTFVMQIARARGARVIVTSSSDEKLAAVGVDDCVNYVTHPAWEVEVLGMTGGLGADVVVDVGGPQTLGHSIHATRAGGTVVMAGFLTGFGSAEFPIARALQHNLHLIGVTVGSVADHAALSAFVTEHRITPRVSRVFGWEELSQAMLAMQSTDHFGKIAVNIP
jgi:NADPH:quinone reductase-like Zn-dependent oxidoreductase